MAKETAIGWCDATFNPWWGCTLYSPGCANCYAKAFAERVGQDIWAERPRRLFGVKHWNEPRHWNEKAKKEGRRWRVFCASMADICEDRPELKDERAKLMQVVHDTPDLDWLFLTKRPHLYVPLFGRHFFFAHRNVWVGFTAENQARLDECWPHVEAIPTAVRWVSAEPLLEDMGMAKYLYTRFDTGDGNYGLNKLSWVVVGAESGDRRRDCGVSAIVSVAAQCRSAGVPLYVKQDCARFPGQQGRIPDSVWKLKQFPDAILK